MPEHSKDSYKPEIAFAKLQNYLSVQLIIMEVQEEKTYFNSLTSPKSFHLIMEVHNKFDYIFLKIFVNKYEEQKLALSLGQMLHC